MSSQFSIQNSEWFHIGEMYNTENMSKRLEYIDALRGLAILLVVFMHVPQYGFGQSIGGYYMEMATLLAVPLFFFISGLFVPLKITPPFQ